MPISYSKKKNRDTALLQSWDRKSDASFAELGIDKNILKSLQSELQGKIVLPGDPGYNTDRMIANPIFDYYPAAIIYCDVETDVLASLATARQYGLVFEIRSGGHCTAGFSSGPGLLIDVSNLNSIVIDAVAKTATVGTGVTFGDFNKQLNLYGLHVPGGECPDVCIGGYVQGGGYGFTSCTFGMNCDNVLSMKVMLADGSIVVASPSQNYDLWWAMRGGTGGNFSVLLSVEYKLVDLTDVYGFALIWPLTGATALSNAADAMMLLQEQYMDTSPWAPYLTLQVSTSSQSVVIPGTPPGGLEPYLLIRGLFTGDPSLGPQIIAPLQAMPGCITQWTAVRRYIVMNQILLSFPQEMPPIFGSAPLYEYKASRYVSQKLGQQDWQKIFAYFCTAKPNAAYGYLEFYGGRIAKSQPNESAFVHRKALYNSVMDVFFAEPTGTAEAEAKAWLDGWKALMEPYWDGEIYQNYCELGQQNYEQAYWAWATPSLSQIKGKYDPTNFFRFAQQVPMPDAGLSDWGGLDQVQEAFGQPISFAGGVNSQDGNG